MENEMKEFEMTMEEYCAKWDKNPNDNTVHIIAKHSLDCLFRLYSLDVQKQEYYDVVRTAITERLNKGYFGV